MLQPSLARAVRETGIPSAVRVRFLVPRALSEAGMGNGDHKAPHIDSHKKTPQEDSWRDQLLQHKDNKPATDTQAKEYEEKRK